MVQIYSTQNLYLGKIVLVKANGKVQRQSGCTIAQRMDEEDPNKYDTIRTNVNLDKLSKQGNVYFEEQHPLSYVLSSKENKPTITADKLDKVFKRRDKAEKTKTKFKILSKKIN